MVTQLQKDLEELKERLANSLRYGLIKNVDETALKVIVDLGNGLETPALPYFVASTGNATLYSLPKVGDKVLIVAPNGSIEQALVFPSVYKQGQTNDNDFALTFEKGAIEYKEGELKIKADTKVTLKSSEVELAGSDGGGVVCKNNLCAFTGAFHPDASSKVKAGV